jgi:DHA2 family multidrug resistance protein
MNAAGAARSPSVSQIVRGKPGEPSEPHASRAVVNAISPAVRGPLTFGMMLATVMTALDTMITNIALPHMQGSLSASPEQITWVLTSYIVATAVMTPLCGWLTDRLGLKFVMLLSVGGFTVASILCGMAVSLPQMVLFRVLQGMLGAPMLPLSQALLLNINPPERHGRAMALFTTAAVVSPAVGPVIGSFLTEELSWRWCFYINIPAGIASLLLLWTFLPRDVRRPRRFDFLGFGSLAVAVAAVQLLLDRGPSQDWFGSREICIEAVLALGGFWIYATHTLTARHPLFNASLARDRNFVSTAIFRFFFSVLTFASLTLLPLLMQNVLGYSVVRAGWISMPRGVLMLLVLQVMGRLDAMVDRRLLMVAGVSIMTFACWQMTQFDLTMTGRQIVFATLTQGLGQGILFVPVATLGFATLDPALRPDASAASNLLANLGGSVGVSLMQAMMAFNSQRMHASLAAHVTPDNPVLRADLPLHITPETALALNEEISRQATMVAFLDNFRLMVLIGLCCLPLVLVLRQPRKAPAAAAAS